MILRFITAIQEFSRENNLECEIDFPKESATDMVDCTFFNPVTEKHITYNVRIADEEDLDGAIDIIKEDVTEELILHDKENSSVPYSQET
jgi:hypothetical protein